jgi:hypothetical protein
VKHRLERGEITAAHRRIVLVLEGEDFLVAAHRQLARRGLQPLDLSGRQILAEYDIETVDDPPNDYTARLCNSLRQRAAMKTDVDKLLLIEAADEIEQLQAGKQAKDD